MHSLLIAKLLLIGGLSLDPSAKHAMPVPNGQAQRPIGISAIQVSEKGTHPFTQQDVALYFQTHNLPHNLSPNSEFAVDSLEFLTSAEVSVILNGESTGLEDKDVIGFARLSGHFVFSGPGGKTARFQHAYAAFDAVNGNLLMIGTL